MMNLNGRKHIWVEVGLGCSRSAKFWTIWKFTLNSPFLLFRLLLSFSYHPLGCPLYIFIATLRRRVHSLSMPRTLYKEVGLRSPFGCKCVYVS